MIPCRPIKKRCMLFLNFFLIQVLYCINLHFPSEKKGVSLNICFLWSYEKGI